MKLLAMTGGRRNGNTETLTKEALMRAEDMGIDVELLRIVDFDIKPCKACAPCPVMMKGATACIYKDDALFLRDKVLDADALIIAAPVYCNTPPGSVLNMRDRVFGPKMDVSAYDMLKDSADPVFKSMFENLFSDQRLFKKRVGALISVGGAPLSNWTSLGLPNLHTVTFPLQVKIVDQLDVTGSAEHGSVVIKEDLMARVGRLGQHLAESMKNGTTAWKGEEPAETCPVCHRNAIVFEKGSMQVECIVCGIKGNIVIKSDMIDIEWPETELKDSRLMYEGLAKHGREIMEVAQALGPDREQIPEKLAKYKAYKKCIVKPPKRVSQKINVS